MVLIEATLNGLLLGGVYAIISIGLTLVFGVMNIVNFAHAAFVMVGMYAAYFLWQYTGIDPLIGAVPAFFVGGLLGLLVHQIIIRRVLNAGALTQIFATVGLLIVLDNLALVLFGSQTHGVSTPYQTTTWSLGPFLISVPYFAAFMFSLVAALALFYFLQRTRAGRAMQATSQNAVAATLMGVNTSRVYYGAFALGTALTAMGGAVILPYSTVSPTAGDQYILIMFTAVVLGGLGSILGALVGGLAIGIVQNVSALVFPIQLQNLIVFVVFLTVLTLRPQGLLRGAAK